MEPENTEVTTDVQEGKLETPPTEDVLSLLNKNVAERIAGSTTKIVDAVVDQFVTQEINRRTELLFKAITECNKLREDFKKIKPDVQTFNIEGKVQNESWSKTKIDERKKALETLKKKEKIIEKALAGDYSLLLNSNG